MDEAEREVFRTLEKVGRLKAVDTFARRRSVPFFWSSQVAEQPPRLLHNGTLTYLFTGGRYIGITNEHVYRTYLSDLESEPDVEAQFNGNTIYPEKRIIDRSGDLDLATFDVPQIFVSSNNDSVFHTPASWPPAPAVEGEIVIYGGYPGSLRAFAENQIHEPFQTFIGRIREVTGTTILLHADFAELFWPGHEGERINENLGGISGGPVFRIIEKTVEGERRIYFELVGIIFEHIENWKVIRARHVSHVQADGTLQSVLKRQEIL